MTRLLFLALIAYLLYRFFGKRSIEAKEAPEEKAEEAFLDPVCGRYVTDGEAVVGRLGEERIHFCSMECLEKYREQLDIRENTQKGNGKE